MALNTRIRFFLAGIFLTMWAGSFFAQPVIPFRERRVSPVEAEALNVQFSHYALATVETGAVSDLLRSANAFDEIRLEADGKVYRFGLRANDLRDATYTLRVATDTGIVRMPRAANMTYAGLTLRGNYPVRITANEVYFSGMIGQDDGFVFIEPLREYIKGAPANEFIIYHERDARKHFTNDQCGAGHAHQIPATLDQDEDILTEGHDDARRACKVIQIALANDHWMYDEYNSIPGVEAHNMAVINNVSTNYDDEFNDDLQFTVVEIFVSTSVGTDPWPQSTDIYVILDDFTDWGPNGFDNTHDVASLWSGRNFSGDVIGLAWVGAVCTSFRYNVVEDFTSNANFLRVLQAHELGHNFNASHDASGSNTIMAPSVNNSNNWSTQSINQINSFINQINCLGPCQAPQPPVADFDASPREGCAPLVVAFDDMSSNNPTSWNWTFPGGTPGTSTAQNPVVTYSTPGLYNVTLTVSNAQGSNAITQFDFIEVFPDPVADFDYFDNQGVVSFTNLSLHADSYFWEFGDGEVSTVANPVHTYPEDGFYTVTLTVFNECGEDTFTITIEVVTPPTALFDSDITEGCQPLDVQFYNLSSDNAVSFEWSFPGGNPSSSTEFEPFVTYPAPGEYTVTLQAFNSAGEDIFSISDYILVEPEPVADFTFTTAGLTVSFNSSASQAESFDWNFGDGGTSTQPNPTHTYLNSGTYNVTLTVTTDCGTDILQLVVTVLDVPVAGIGSNVQSGCSPLTVQFQSISSGNPTSHAWIFEGGSPGTSNQANPVVTYNTPGTYDVQLTVTNAIGSDVIVLSNYITVLAPTVSDFTYAVNGATAAFTNESAHATSWLWDFGDGDTSAAEDPTHLYGADGTYTVMLVSTGACGSDTSFAQITISTPAQAGFTWQFSGDCVPMTAQFFSTSSANTTAVEWSFPGGSPSTSTAMNPTVTYATPGAYDVTLIAHAPAGSDTLTWSELIDVGSAPDAAFLLATSDLTVTFTNQSVGGSTFFWDFGDGNTSTAENPVHTYPGFGSYTIVMYAENACGADTTEVTIVLGTVPNALFIYSAHNGCAPFQVQFTDQSQNSPTSWLWTFPGGDPATSTAQNPLVTYAIPGSYFVSLRATNVAGTDVLVLDDLIQVAGEPDATFNYTQEGNEIALEYAGTDYDSLRWDFGDGRRDNSLNPTVTYPLDGTYEISLIVFNACGADTASAFVTINVTSTNDPNLNPDRWTLNPNPFGRDLTLSGTPLTDGRLRVEIYDLQGKRISLDEWEYTAGPLSRRLDTDAAAEGMVVIVLNNGTQRIALRAVKTNR